MLKGLGDMGKLMKQAQEMQSKMQEEMGKVTEGLPLPPGMKLPF